MDKKERKKHSNRGHKRKNVRREQKQKKRNKRQENIEYARRIYSPNNKGIANGQESTDY